VVPVTVCLPSYLSCFCLFVFQKFGPKILVTENPNHVCSENEGRNSYFYEVLHSVYSDDIISTILYLCGLKDFRSGRNSYRQVKI
jgi:hypothetical protein